MTEPPPSDPYQQAFDRLQAQLLAAKAETSEWAGSCATCRFFRPIGHQRDELCRNPLVTGYRTNPLTGDLVERPHLIRRWYFPGEPRIPDLCGPTRSLWGEKDKPRNWFQRLLDWIGQ